MLSMLRAFSLMFHDVVDPCAADASGFNEPGSRLYKLSRGEFARHLAALQAATGNCKSSLVTDKNRNGTPQVYLTFDDGGVSAFTTTADMLEGYGRRGHFFVVTGRIGTPGFLSEDQIRSLHARGHLIGSHSVTHPERFACLPREAIAREWRDSIRRLSEIIGESVRCASVPNGDFSPLVADIAAEEGVEALFTSEPRSRVTSQSSCAIYGRYAVKHGMQPRQTVGFATGGRIVCTKQAVIWEAKRIAKTVAPPLYFAVRRRLTDS